MTKKLVRNSVDYIGELLASRTHSEYLVTSGGGMNAMYKRYFLLLCVSVGLGVASSWAANFWLKKKYSEWTPKEVRQMLNDSPWATQVEVNIKGASGSGGAGIADGRGRPTIISSERQGRGGESVSERQVSPPKPKVLVRFHTALPIKQAIARGRFGDQVLESPEAARMLTRAEDAYLVGITGLPKLIAANPAGLKGNAQMVFKGREPISAQDVTMDHGEAGLVIYFFFSRQPNPIKIEDDDFELQIKSPQFEIKRRFKLKDMVFDGRLEL